MMSVSVATKVFLISTSAIPISYLLNRFIEKTGLTQPLLIVFLCHIIGILIFSLIVKCTKHSLHKNNEYLFYTFALICFISVSSLIIALELEGLISGFTNSFLKHVEPHLRSSFGAMICHWNGIVAYALALMIVAAITTSNDFIDILCYWLGSWVNNSLVLLLGIMIGKTGPGWGILMYLPYIILPCYIAYRVLKSSKSTKNQAIEIEVKTSIWKRPLDMSLCFIFTLSCFIAILRGLAVLDSPIWLCKIYGKQIEPYLVSSTLAPFAKIQMILYLFYYLPFYLFAIYHLICCSHQEMTKLSAFFAGAASSAQFTHIGSSFHSRTPYILRVSSDFSALLFFWLVNLTLLVGPVLLAFRCAVEETTEYPDGYIEKVFARKKIVKQS
ncbi:transmembrane 6 superfamily member 1 [Tetranychus urticae]|uniref:EXPERA domain-containing protein n=1 Tax=Tetranychus urticae TaxID=32264 RepID=T1JVM3_TETUR|nr:transmembrane 6 superfamily member 1 [Tetranychus urticae]XP_015795067.1 transmembrane 6 superfamily member 1 [Tetranychus urticae]